MSRRCHKGDRVRLTIEGVVTSRGSHFVFIDGHADGIAEEAFEVTILQRALPTEAGAVIRHEGCYLVLSTMGEWGCPDHGQADLSIGGFEVIFDGVQS